jgi:hypothetical protein
MSFYLYLSITLVAKALVMASTAMSEISRLDLQELDEPTLASITGVKALSSYNWIEAPTPTITVPGSPALWSVPEVSRRLKKDSGLIYIAQNAARHPESPLEPLFRALYITHPSFDIRSIDVVTDRNNIRKLLSFVDPSSTRDGLEAFTMNIEVTKDTAIFCRDEAKTLEYIEPHEFKGFGHEFEKAYTISQVKGSTGHHRIITYRFGDMSFIVRHETDGYVTTDTKTSSSQAKDNTRNDLSSMLEALSLSPASSISSGSKLMIKEGGYEIPLASTLEIKTRALHKPLEMHEVVPQLWLSQTPNLVRAYHQKGIFQRPVVEDVATIIKIWEERKQKDLRKLAALIRKIISLVKECGGSAILKYNVEGDKLVICKVESKKMLPKDLYCKWDDGHYKVNTETQNDGVQGLENAQTESKSAVSHHSKANAAMELIC